MRIVVPSTLSRADLLDVVRREGSSLRSQDLPPDMLRHRTVASRDLEVKFVLAKDDRVQVTLNGVRTNSQSGVELEPRCRIMESPDGRTSRIEFELGVATSTKVLAALMCAFVSYVAVKNSSDDPSWWLGTLAFIGFVSCFFLFLMWLEFQRVTSVLWPGLVELVRRLAAGSFRTHGLAAGETERPRSPP